MHQVWLSTFTLFAMNTFFLKKYYAIILTTVFVYGCGSSTGNKKDTDDSLQYYPPTPESLTTNEFRSYFRQLSQFLDRKSVV